MQKEISVIVPVYNGEKYIDQFMKNILSQSIFEHLFFIIVNDGSKDCTYEKLKKYEAQYPHSIKVLTKENGGVSSARNKGLDMVETRYFSFADIDDLMHPCLFERLYKIISHSNADMVCSAVRKVSVEQTKSLQIDLQVADNQEIKNYNSEAAIRWLLEVPDRSFIGSKMYRSDTLDGIRLDERLAIAEDKLYVFQCMTHSKNILISSDVLYFYIQQPGSAMSYANARTKLGQDIVLDIIDKEVKTKYPDSYALCAARRAAIHAGAYIKVYTNDRHYQDRCKYYRTSVRKCPIRFVLSELSISSTVRVFLVRYLPIVLLWKRFHNRKYLL